MLIIKHVEANGRESLTQALAVGFDPGNVYDQNSSPNPTLTIYGAPGPDGGAQKDGVIKYGDGTVYVMNETGKTIEVYRLERTK